MSSALFVFVVAVGLAGCSPGDGEGARYIGRVTSVSAKQICVGPSTSSEAETCGTVPEGQLELPHVGQCVGLFPARSSDGDHIHWSTDSVRLHYKDEECK
jgi:hypothetical protein